MPKSNNSRWYFDFHVWIGLLSLLDLTNWIPRKYFCFDFDLCFLNIFQVSGKSGSVSGSLIKKFVRENILAFFSSNYCLEKIMLGGVNSRQRMSTTLLEKTRDVKLIHSNKKAISSPRHLGITKLREVFLSVTWKNNKKLIGGVIHQISF